MAFCLPPAAVNAFRNAIANGEIDPVELINMTSEERRAHLARFVGDENAPDVNALLESKLLQKNQIHGLTQWAKQVAGMKPEVKRDLLASIGRIDHLLNPGEVKDFLADHVRQRLGVSVTMDQAKKISELGRATKNAEAAMLADTTRNPFRRGHDPVPESEVKYGLAYQDMTDYVNSLKPDNRTFIEKFSDAANIPRTILTLGHLSAPLVQGWGMLGTRVGAQTAIRQLDFLKSEDAYRRDLAGMIGHPMYQKLMRAGLPITNLTRNLNQREEAIQSSIVERVNAAIKKGTGGVVPNVARAGSRAFTGYLNHVRFYRAVDIAKGAEMMGKDLSFNSPVLEDIAHVVGNFTGRGDLGGGKLEQMAPMLNSLFFAPRKIAATVQMFNPQTYLDPRIDSTARIAAIKQLSGALMVTAGILGLSTAMGFNVNMNPIDTRFAKIQLPNGATIDVTGGNAVYVRLLSRLITGREISAKGRELELGMKPAPTRMGLIGQFLQNKLSPMAAMVMDVMNQQNPIGQPITPQGELYDKAMPIALQSFINFASAVPQNYASLAFVPFILFGAGVEPPFTAPPRHRMVSQSRHG